MCGIAGFVDAPSGGGDDATLTRTARAMADRLWHRGPDAGGAWADAAAGVALGHRRLSIIDLSEAGAQPMTSRDGRLVVSYNGEVYNAPDLRAELEAAGVRFRGHSDTEVLVEACARWGVRETLARLVGMFAFALWDTRDRTLTLARDQIGIKPLYWARFGPLFLFGSELKALRAHPGFTAALDRDAIAAFLRYKYVPAPYTVYRGVNKLLPGTMLTLRPGTEPVVEAFWSLEDAYRRAKREPFTGTAAEATDALEDLLKDAVGRQMASDVPLGAFLSGGIDSSTVAALMNAASGNRVRTFSIGFAEHGYNEAEHAAGVARHLGTDHTELYVTPEEARDVIPKLPEVYDEPFADSSQIPTWCVSALTRRHVTVALSGDGGDELFGGYPRYFRAERYRRTVYRLPAPLRRAGARAVRAVPPGVWDAAFAAAPRRYRGAAGERLHGLAPVLAGSADDLFRRTHSHWPDPAALVAGARELDGPLGDPSIRALIPDFFERMQYLDTLTYLPDDILTKVDRASMAVSLEVRVPLLDHRVVEFAWRLPKSMRVRGGVGKWLLRRVLYRHVPPALIDRPKKGFSVPIDVWLRGPLRDWADSLLSERALRESALFEPAPVRRAWQQHLDRRRDLHYPLWDVLMVQAWLAHTDPPAADQAYPTSIGESLPV